MSPRLEIMLLLAKTFCGIILFTRLLGLIEMPIQRHILWLGRFMIMRALFVGLSLPSLWMAFTTLAFPIRNVAFLSTLAFPIRRMGREYKI